MNKSKLEKKCLTICSESYKFFKDNNAGGKVSNLPNKLFLKMTV